MRLLSDPKRLRVLMLVAERELCVCQIMGVLNISQPLVSRNLNQLSSAGFLRGRKEGKMVFYSLDPRMKAFNRCLLELLKDTLKADKMLTGDLRSLRDCEDFQKRTGRCDMKTFSAYLKKKRRSS